MKTSTYLFYGLKISSAKLNELLWKSLNSNGYAKEDSSDTPFRFEVIREAREHGALFRVQNLDTLQFVLPNWEELMRGMSLEGGLAVGGIEFTDEDHVSWQESQNGEPSLNLSNQSSLEDAFEDHEEWHKIVPEEWIENADDEELTIDKMYGLVEARLGAVTGDQERDVYHARFTKCEHPVVIEFFSNLKALQGEEFFEIDSILSAKAREHGGQGNVVHFQLWSSLIQRLDDPAPFEYSSDRFKHMGEQLEHSLREFFNQVATSSTTILLPGLAVFYKQVFPAYEGRNPRTGQAVLVPEKKVLFIHQI